MEPNEVGKIDTSKKLGKGDIIVRFSIVILSVLLLAMYVKSKPVSLEYLTKNCELGNSNDCVLVGHSYRFQKKDYDRAIYWYQQACDLNNGVGCFMQGLVYSVHKFDDMKARRSYKRAVRLNHAGAHNNLGTIALVNGELGLAVKLFTKGHELGDPNAYVNLGTALQKMGRVGEAKELYRSVCENKKWAGDACGKLAILARKEGDFETCKKYLLKSLEKREFAGIKELDNAILGNKQLEAGLLNDIDRVASSESICSVKDTIVPEKVRIRKLYDPKASYAHPAGFVFPSEVNNMSRGDLERYDDVGENVSAPYYHIPLGITATVYVYPELILGQTFESYFKQTAEYIATSFTDIELLEIKNITIALSNREIGGYRALFAVSRPHSEMGESNSELYIFPLAEGWFLKFRITYSVQNQKQATPVIKEFLNGFRLSPLKRSK